jgi:hypothetical protein
LAGRRTSESHMKLIGILLVVVLILAIAIAYLDAKING